jgi:hypothetical protein
MLLRRLRQFAFAITAITAPLTASAQVLGGSVTVAPIATEGAPVLGWAGLAALVLALGIGAALMLRRSRPRVVPMVGVLTLVLLAAARGAPVLDVIIAGDECRQVWQENYEPLKHIELESQCPNLIRIIDLQLNCDRTGEEAPIESVSGTVCEVGLIIPTGGSCLLPGCPC